MYEIRDTQNENFRHIRRDLRGLRARGVVLCPWRKGRVQGNADAGRQKSSMCVGCHNIPGSKTAFPSVYSVPKSRRSARAVYGERASRIQGGASVSIFAMRAVAASLSDQDMADLAAFYAAVRQVSVSK